MVDTGKKKNIFDKLFIAIRPKKEPTDIVEYAEKIIRDFAGARPYPIGRVKRGNPPPYAGITVMLLALTGIIYGALKIFL